MKYSIGDKVYSLALNNKREGVVVDIIDNTYIIEFNGLGTYARKECEVFDYL